MDKPVDVYIYTRVSTVMQIDGYSLEYQKEKLEEYAKFRNMNICGYYEDAGKSGKNIKGRPSFQKMLDDIKNRKDNIKFILCWKISRFGRSCSDVLNTLKFINKYGVNLICTQDGIDSSQGTGKLVITLLSSVAEIERENILMQSYYGKYARLKSGEWGGGHAPYGYILKDGKLIIDEDEAENVKMIFKKYSYENMGLASLANWMNSHGYQKKAKTVNERTYITQKFIRNMIENPVYIGRLTWGKRTNELIEGSDEEYHVVQHNEFETFKGTHEAIISMDLWNAAQGRRKAMSGKREKREKEHEYIFSGLIKCPKCGKYLYGIPMRGKKRKSDGTFYPTYYAYGCRASLSKNGTVCGWGQISCSKIDREVESVIYNLINKENFETVMNELLDEKLNAEKYEKEDSELSKSMEQAVGVQRKLEQQLDTLDILDTHYDRKYESLSRRLDAAFDRIDELECRRKELSSILQGIERKKIDRESVYRALTVFKDYYAVMSEFERKSFVRTFISEIILYEDKKQHMGSLVKCIKFCFPVSYDGKIIYEISPPYEKHTEVCVSMRGEKVSVQQENIDDVMPINVNVNDISGRRGGASYKEIQEYIVNKFGFKTQPVYIAQVKNELNIKERGCYHKVQKLKYTQYNVPPNKRIAIIEAFKHFQMI